jgi:hypothetical protein
MTTTTTTTCQPWCVDHQQEDGDPIGWCRGQEFTIGPLAFNLTNGTDDDNIPGVWNGEAPRMAADCIYLTDASDLAAALKGMVAAATPASPLAVEVLASTASIVGYPFDAEYPWTELDVQVTTAEVASILAEKF